MIEQQILEFVRSNILASRVAVDSTTPLYTSGLLTSLAHLRLVQFLERDYGILVEMAHLGPENFDSVERIAAYVSATRAAAEAAPRAGTAP
jgi:acyl carrier protein